MVTLISKARAIVGLVIAQVRHRPSRTTLAVLGITLAVLSTTLLASVGFGVLETGTQMFDDSGRDLWVTGGPIELSPGAVGGFKNTILDSHVVAQNIQEREDVATAVPMAFKTVYISTNGSEFDTIVGVGMPKGGGQSVSVEAGTSFTKEDIHYGNGSYNGPMTHEVVIDPRIAEMYNLSVGETVYIGGTIVDAKQNEFTVVGISPTFSRFLGAPTVAVHLSELQEITGTTGTDRATWITIKLTDGANTTAVQQELQQQYPEYDIRTNREQLESILNDKAIIVAAAGTLVVLAIIAGLALTINLLALIVYQQQTELAALKAVGLSSRTLVGVVAGQGIVLGAIGGAFGLALTPPAVIGLNYVATQLVGFEDLLQTPDTVLIAGGVIALVIGTISAMVAGWRITRINPLVHLRG